MNEKVSITIAWREDGGLRVWSKDMPGLILSGPDPAQVMASVLPAIAALLAHKSAALTSTYRGAPDD